MPPILLCWPTSSEANVVGMAVQVEPSRQYSVKFRCRATDDSRGAVWQNGVWHWTAYETKACNWIPPCGKKLHPMTFIDACWTFTETKRWMLAQWGGGWRISAVATATWKTKPRSGRPCTAVTPRNKEFLDQLILRNGGLRLGNCVQRLISVQCVGNDGGNIGIS